jgi:hypothetical protein
MDSFTGADGLIVIDNLYGENPLEYDIELVVV